KARATRATRATSKAKKLADTRAAFDAQYPDIAPFLHEAQRWAGAGFLDEMQVKLNQYGALTEPQVAAVRRVAAKVAERREEKGQEREAARQTVDLSPIRAMFEAARESGHKAPIYRAAGLVISRAPDHGRNPGALYVKTEDDEYLGKIL